MDMHTHTHALPSYRCAFSASTYACSHAKQPQHTCVCVAMTMSVSQREHNRCRLCGGGCGGAGRATVARRMGRAGAAAGRLRGAVWRACCTSGSLPGLGTRVSACCTTSLALAPRRKSRWMTCVRACVRVRALALWWRWWRVCSCVCVLRSKACARVRMYT